MNVRNVAHGIEKLFLNPIGAVVLSALLLFGVLWWDRDPMGVDYERRVQVEIEKCINASHKCVGGTIFLRDGISAPVTPHLVARMKFMYEYSRTKLIRQVASVQMKS